MQISDAYAGPVCGGRLHTGVLPLRPEQQKQTSPQLVVGGVQGIREEVQEEPESALSSPPHQLHPDSLEDIQASHQVL